MGKYLMLFCLFFQFAYASHVWLDSENISSDCAMCPNLALNSKGDAVSAWMVKNDEEFIFQVATKLVGKAWDTPLEIARCKVLGNRPWKPKLAIDSNGNAIAIWCENDSKGKTIIRSSSKLLGQSWSIPDCLSVNSPGGFHDIDPQLAVDAAGNAIAIWKRSNGIQFNVLFATKSFGQEWSNCLFFSQNGSQGSPYLIMNSSGYAVASWSHFPDTTNCILQSTTKLWGGMWSEPIDVSIQFRNSWFSSKNVGGGASRLAINTKGDLAIIWEGYHDIIYASEKSHEYEWTSPSCLSNTSAVASNSELAIDHLGNIIATWVECDDELKVKSAIKTIGSNWSSAVTLSSNLFSDDADTSLPIPYPKFMFDQEGNAIVAWIKYSGGSSFIQMVTKATGENWTAPSDLYFVNGIITDLQMGIDSNQNVTFVWEEKRAGQQFIKSIVGLKQ